jgi:hypothetical protein
MSVVHVGAALYNGRTAPELDSRNTDKALFFIQDALNNSRQNLAITVRDKNRVVSHYSSWVNKSGNFVAPRGADVRSEIKFFKDSFGSSGANWEQTFFKQLHNHA